MTWRAVDVVEVPDGLVGVGILIGQEPTAVALCEDPRETPAPKRSDVEDVGREQVSRRGTLDPKRSAQDVDQVEIDVPDVIGAVGVVDLEVGPLLALEEERVARFDFGDRRDLWGPAIAPDDLLFLHAFRGIDLEVDFISPDIDRTFQIRLVLLLGIASCLWDLVGLSAIAFSPSAPAASRFRRVIFEGCIGNLSFKSPAKQR